MNDRFDELTRNMAQSVTRRGALKQFGLGLAGLALVALGLADEAHAARDCDKVCTTRCKSKPDPNACYLNCMHRCEGGCC